MPITTNAGRSLYDNGIPLPGKITRTDPGQLIIAGFVSSAKMPFGRVVAKYEDDSTGEKSFAPIDNTTTESDGIAVYSSDAIEDQENLQYSQNEACGIINRGFVVIETAENIDPSDTTLTVINGENSGDEDDVGKLAHTTGTGYSVVTGLRVSKRLSSTLVEVHVKDTVTLTAG